MEPRQPPSEDHQSLLGLGKPWTRVGYGVLAVAVLSFLVNVFVHPVFFLPPNASPPPGYQMVGGKDGGAAVLKSALGIVGVFTLIFSPLAGLVWTLVDIVDRRKRFVWLLPMFVCPLVGGLHALPLALYLFFGRETPPEETGVK